jgi:hypothetical protein
MPSNLMVITYQNLLIEHPSYFIIIEEIGNRFGNEW